MNNRDWALLIVSVIIIVALLYTRGFRTLVVQSMGLFTDKVIFIPFLTVIFYILGIVLLMVSFGFSDTAVIKDSISWTLSVGLLTFFKVTSYADMKRPIVGYIKETISLSLIVEFLLNAFTFSLAFELILLPFITVLFLIKAAIVNGAEDSRMKKMIKKTIAVWGWILILFSCIQIYMNWNIFWSLSTLKSFLYPVILSFLYVPCLYLLIYYLHLDEFISKRQKVISKTELIGTIISYTKLKLSRIKYLRYHLKIKHLSSIEEIKTALRNINAAEPQTN